MGSLFHAGSQRRVLVRKIERRSRTKDAPPENKAPKPAAADSALHVPKGVQSSDKGEANDKARAEERNVSTPAPQDPKVGIRAGGPADPAASPRSAGPQTAQATTAKPEYSRTGPQKPEIALSTPPRAVPFSPGDRVRHPKYGHGRVKQVATEDVGGQRLDLVHIDFDDKDAVVKIPVKSAASQGLHNVSRGGVS